MPSLAGWIRVAYPHTHTHNPLHIKTHVLTHPPNHTPTWMDTHTRARARTHTHLDGHTHTHSHAHTHILTHPHTTHNTTTTHTPQHHHNTHTTPATRRQGPKAPLLGKALAPRDGGGKWGEAAVVWGNTAARGFLQAESTSQCTCVGGDGCL
jgi:hypothetical protein